MTITGEVLRDGDTFKVNIPFGQAIGVESNGVKYALTDHGESQSGNPSWSIEVHITDGVDKEIMFSKNFDRATYSYIAQYELNGKVVLGLNLKYSEYGE